MIFLHELKVSLLASRLPNTLITLHYYNLIQNLNHSQFILKILFFTRQYTFDKYCMSSDISWYKLVGII